MSEQEDRKARAVSWLVVGGVLTWKVVKSAAGALLRLKGPSPSAEPKSDAARMLKETADAGREVVDASIVAFHRLAEHQPAPETDPSAHRDLSGRAGDRNLDLEEGVDLQKRQQSGTLLVLCALALGVAGAAGFMVIYWTGGNNLLLGSCLAAFFAGFGAALVFWSHRLTIRKEAIDPREEFPSPAPERERAFDEFQAGWADVRRRRLLQWAGFAGAGLLATMVVSILRSLGFPPSTALYTRVWKRGQRLMTLDGKPVSVDTLRPGSTTVVFPEDSIGSEKSQTVLVRVHSDLLRLPASRTGWAPGGNLAYSRICTHAGCNVGLYETTTHQLMCPCHQSTFDVLDGAQPTGGPAARPLPQLPLYVDSDGFLRAGGGFTDPPGPGFWGMPWPS